MVRSAFAGALALVAGCVGIADASQAPGRVVLPLVPGASVKLANERVAPVAAGTLDDGRVLITTRVGDGSLSLLRLLPSGALDETFGDAGTVRLTAGALVGTDPVAVVALPHGSAYLVVKPAGKEVPSALSVAHVLADGGLDPAYGQGGVALTTATWRDALAGWHVPAEAAQPDGKLVLSSGSGPPIRLLTDGREDRQFAAPVATTRSTVGAVLRDGRIVLIDGLAHVVVLRSDGSPDPNFNAGHPLSTGSTGLSAVLAGPNGTVDVFGSDALRLSGTGGVLERAVLAGAPSAGSLAFREADGGTLAVPPLGKNGTHLISLDAAFGRLADADYHQPRFGGTFSQAEITRHVDWASASAFQGQVFLARGSGLLVVGTVSLTDADMRRHDEIAVGALHSDSTPDTSFAGPATPMQIRANLVPHHPLAADVTVPRAGAVLVQAWDRRHHQVAQGRRAAFTARTLRVRLSLVNRRRRASRIALYTVSYRDLAGSNTSITKRSLRH